jgi:hypothetical protein
MQQDAHEAITPNVIIKINIDANLIDGDGIE